MLKVLDRKSVVLIGGLLELVMAISGSFKEYVLLDLLKVIRRFARGHKEALIERFLEALLAPQ